MNFQDTLSYLLSLGHETLTIKLGLTNTQTLLEALGNPQKNFPAVQIAGTNGKGSTAVMLDSICHAARIRVGLFTSPHLISITERVRVNGEPISQTEFARITAHVQQTAERLVDSGNLEALPTFFEHITAIALLAFSDAKVELAILETGLGGRLDSTTAAEADVVAITSIAMDHEEYLGHSLEEIAAEKGAIIRPRVTTIVAPQKQEVLKVILDRCETERVEPKIIKSDSIRIIDTSSDGRYCANFKTNNDNYDNILLGLRGRHQVTNAAVAIGLVEALNKRGFVISKEAIKRGLETACHPGRLEIRELHPRILFDGAHNPAAALALRDYLDEFVTGPITMIFGAMRDKAVDEMAAILFPKATELILTEVDNPRGASLEMLKSIVGGELANRAHYSKSPAEALQIATELAGRTGLICVTGSLYLVGAIQEATKPEILESSFAKA